jgi:dienelactone hydrolase
MLLGYLSRPDLGMSALLAAPAANVGRYPAVVLLHGCTGVSSHSAAIADRLGSWGVRHPPCRQSRPRGILTRCGGGGLDQAFDAYAALRYLAHQEFFDPARIAVFGQSMGGFSALYAVDHDLAAQYFKERFRAAIVYYGGCGIPLSTMTAPTLILTGEADEANPAERCREMVA